MMFSRRSGPLASVLGLLAVMPVTASWAETSCGIRERGASWTLTIPLNEWMHVFQTTPAEASWMHGGAWQPADAYLWAGDYGKGFEFRILLWPKGPNAEGLNDKTRFKLVPGQVFRESRKGKLEILVDGEPAFVTEVGVDAFRPLPSLIEYSEDAQTMEVRIDLGPRQVSWLLDAEEVRKLQERATESSERFRTDAPCEPIEGMATDALPFDAFDVNFAAHSSPSDY